MSFKWILNIYLPIVLLYLGLMLLAMGAYFLVKKKPLVFKAYVFGVLLSLCFFPIALVQLYVFVNKPSSDTILNVIYPLIFLILTAWPFTQGWYVLGLSFIPLRKVINKTLDALNLPYETEPLKARLRHVQSVINIPDLKVMVKFSSTLWFSMSQIKVLPRKEKQNFVPAINKMKEIFKEPQVVVSQGATWTCLIMGMFCFVLMYYLINV